MKTPTTYEETLTLCDRCNTPISFVISQEHYGECACSRWKRKKSINKWGTFLWGDWEFADYKEEHK